MDLCRRGQFRIAAYLRLTDVNYPDTSDISYAYGDLQTDPVDYIMSRLSAIKDSGISANTLSGYSYLGAGTLVTEDYKLAQVKLDYSANNLADLDRFGRVLDQVWAGYGSGNSGTLDGYHYTYNATGDRTTQTNVTDSALDNQFKYDSLDRLTEWDQGPSPNYVTMETWTLDSLGNDWSGSKTYDSANEEAPTSSYDLAGNMTTLLSGDGAVYDAWGRLVKVTNGSTIEQCYYDGLNRRVEVVAGGTTTSDYYAGQQMIQSNVTGGGGYEFVWSPR